MEFFFKVCTKWLPAAILDVWKSLSITFLAISYQYETFIFFFKSYKMAHFGCPKFTFYRISGHFRSICNFIFWGNLWQNGCRPFQIDAQLYFVCKFWTKWLPSAILDVRNSLSIAFQAILDQYRCFVLFKFLTKWQPAAIFWCQKITFYRISGLSDRYATFVLNFGWNDNVNYRTHPRCLDE